MSAEVNTSASSEQRRIVTFQLPPSGKWCAIRRVVYKLSWLPLFTIATTLFGLYFMVLLSDGEFPVPEIGMLVAPLGLVAGWLFASATLERPRLYVLFLISSVVASPLLARRAGMLFKKSEALAGKTGLFSGLSEALEGVLYACLTASAIAISIGSLTMLVDRWRAEPNADSASH
jgi:hypothetical protein